MEHLPAHLEGLARWGVRASEVVAVDGESTDGSLAWIRDHLSHPCLRTLTHPPGLYASWNHAAQQARSDYLTYATIGDTLEPGGIEHLHEVAERFEADVVVSPPRFVAAGGEAHEEAWPIHALLAWLRIDEPTFLSPHDAFWLQHYYKGYALLGSSASNLYRTECLRERPFPTDCGRSGDAAWCLRHVHAVRVAVTPRVVSTFLVHPRPAPDQGRLDEQLVEGLDRLLTEGRRDDLDLPRIGRLRRALGDLASCEAQKEAARERLERARRGGILGSIGRVARRARRERNRMRVLRKRLIGTIETTCRGALPAGPAGRSGWQ